VHPPSRELHPAYIENRNSHPAAAKDDAMWVLRRLTSSSAKETFGLVAPLYRFKSEEDAVKMANDTEFGLASYFYSRDIDRIWRVAEAEYDIVGINEGITSTEIAPFGGMKESGIGPIRRVTGARNTASRNSSRSNISAWVASTASRNGGAPDMVTGSVDPHHLRRASLVAGFEQEFPGSPPIPLSITLGTLTLPDINASGIYHLNAYLPCFSLSKGSGAKRGSGAVVNGRTSRAAVGSFSNAGPRTGVHPKPPTTIAKPAISSVPRRLRRSSASERDEII
jgi:hypothetical protein